MADCLIEGKYVNVKDEAFVSYLIKAGIPKDEAEAMKGTHWDMTIEKTKSGRWVGLIRCEELPKLNSLESYTEGQDKEIDHPLFGGKATLNFTRNGPNGFKCSAKSEKYGVTEWTEKYTEDGIEFDCKHKASGASYKEMWCRKTQWEGWFENTKSEGVEAYMKQAKPPIPFDPDMKVRVHMEKCGEGCVMTEQFDKHSITTRIKLDEQMTYAPGTPFEGKLLCTKVGNRTYRFIYETDRGEETWDMNFTNKGFYYEGTHKPSGASCKMWFEPITNIFGKFKPVSVHNTVKLGTAIGMPEELCVNLANEWSARVELTEEGDGWMRSQYHSKYMPMDLHFKFNEEFDLNLPGGVGSFKVLITREGDTLTEIFTNDKATTISTVKYTGNWLIVTDRIEGTNIWSKMILKRC